ncbi:hypothetical protein F4703DRAFT_1458489 [Phycomyces blakesleeanus]
MSSTHYETHIFQLDALNNLRTQVEGRQPELRIRIAANLESNDLTVVPGKTGRPSEWNDATVKVLLQVIMQRDFYAQHSKLDNSGKARLWRELHRDFCSKPEVHRYAGTIAGKTFSQKYRTVKYIKEKFQTIKKDFHKALAELRKEGLEETSQQSKYLHFDEMKEITRNDKTFWPSIAADDPSTSDDTLTGPVELIIREDESAIVTSRSSAATSANIRAGTGSETTQTLNKPARRRAPRQTAKQAPSTTQATPTTPATPGPGPGPIPRSEPGIGSTNNTEPRLASEFEVECLQIFVRHTNVMESGFASLVSELRQVKELFARSLEDQRANAAAAMEDRRLDRISREKIAEREILYRKNATRESIDSREEYMRLFGHDVQTGVLVPPATTTPKSSTADDSSETVPPIIDGNTLVD